jgi:methyltransferase-like protein
MIGNKEILDGKERDILQNANLKENPFSVPQGYFSSVEEAVHQKIHKEEKVNPLVSFFKTSIALASVFGIVFGLGYGAMYLTDTLDSNTSANQAPVYASNEEENTDEFTISASEEEIEQYLIDSDLSISALAALE